MKKTLFKLFFSHFVKLLYYFFEITISFFHNCIYNSNYFIDFSFQLLCREVHFEQLLKVIKN